VDLLTHLCLPITAVYLVRSELFGRRLPWGLAAFAVFPDVDKVLPVPGGFHSLVTLVPVAGVVLAVEWGVRRDLSYGPVAVALLYSHLLLDVVDGNLVPLLAPLSATGVGFRYPGQFVLGGQWPLTIRGEVLSVLVTVPPSGGGGGGPGYVTYQALGKTGVLSVLLLALVVWADRRA
jgi:hypothetical protein